MSADRTTVKPAVAGERTLGPLSPHEFAVIALASSGLTTKEIAAHLSVSINTVKYHLANVYRKLGAHSRVAATHAYHQLLRGSPSAGARAVLELATRLAAQIASESMPSSRAAYFVVSDGMVRPLIEIDPLNVPSAHGFPLAENHHFATIVATRRPRISRVGTGPLGPNARVSTAAVQVTAGAGVPIVIGHSVHGILAIGARGSEIPEATFSGLIALGQLVEVALASPTFGEALTRLNRASET
jgi:DNA-binding CsgD family transcriptional regulator